MDYSKFKKIKKPNRRYEYLTPEFKQEVVVFLEFNSQRECMELFEISKTTLLSILKEDIMLSDEEKILFLDKALKRYEQKNPR